MQQHDNAFSIFGAPGSRSGIPTWTQLFTATEGLYNRQVIGRYFVRPFDKEGHLRHLGFLLKSAQLGWSVDNLSWTVLLNKWDLEQCDMYRGIWRDLWELPDTERSDLTAGRLLWFLHCFECTHPQLFPGAFEYERERTRKIPA